jgi:DNA-binding NarL/FixJ family response regulator
MADLNDAITVLVVDDHLAFREGLKALLSTTGDITVVGEASNGPEAIVAARDLQPDVVIMDLDMPGSGNVQGVEATRQIVATSPHAAVLVLTVFEDPDSIFAALRAGARGYLLKGASLDQLTRAVRAVADGEAIYSPAIATRIQSYFAAPPTHLRGVSFPELTDREREVLDLIAAGHNNSVIAQRLSIRPKTVRNHISNIFSKLQVADRAQAIVRAREAGLGQATSKASPAS